MLLKAEVSTSPTGPEFLAVWQIRKCYRCFLYKDCPLGYLDRRSQGDCDSLCVYTDCLISLTASADKGYIYLLYLVHVTIFSTDDITS